MKAQLKVDIEPRRLLAVSEPYVTFTSRGYSVAMDVIEKKTKKEYFLYVSAKSLGVAIEQMKSDNGGKITGCEFWVRKKSAEKISEYLVEE